jgi:hypothetical protein
MRRKPWNGAVRALAGIGAGLLVGGTALDASAMKMEFPFSVELDDKATGDFGSLEIETCEGGADLTCALAEGIFRFTIAIDPDLGRTPRINRFYFNVAGDATPELVGDDFELTRIDGRPVRSGAGSGFEYAVNFGGAKRPLTTVSFELAGEGLELEDFYGPNPYPGGRIDAIFAIHLQGARNGHNDIAVSGKHASTPEPGTALLVGLGLVGLAFGGRRRA